MTRWAEIRQAIDAGDLDTTTRLVAALDDRDRREVAAELPAKLKALRAAAQYGWLDRRTVDPLLVAGAGTIGGAAATATWLWRADLPLLSHPGRPGALHEALLKVTAARPAEWRGEVARRIAARLRVADNDVRAATVWRLAADLTLSAGTAPPASDGFVAGWITTGATPAELGADPFLDTLVPRLFEVDGVGAALASDMEQVAWDPRRGSWAEALAALARSGRLDRTALLNGCVSRFLRGGTAHGLRWFVQLYGLLEPTDDESVARVRDLVRLLPTAPPKVAQLAFDTVRRVDDLERLDGALFQEAADALLFRPEKKLVKAGLSWLDRTARRRDRVDTTVRAVSAVFSADPLDLVERAVGVAVKHAGAAGEQARVEVREAAAGLPADQRDRLAAAFGPIETPGGAEPSAAEAPAPAEPSGSPPSGSPPSGSPPSGSPPSGSPPSGSPPSGRPPFGSPPSGPRLAPPPIGSTAELADALAALVGGGLGWDATEHFLAGLVELAFQDPDATRTALERVVTDSAPWLRTDDRHAVPITADRWGLLSVRRLLVPDSVDGRFDPATLLQAVPWWRPGGTPEPKPEHFLARRRHEIASAVGKVPAFRAAPRRRFASVPVPKPEHFTARRKHEIAFAVGRVPVLLATPTDGNGRVDAGVLVERLGRLERAGAEPGRTDLTQALLRLPREIDPAATARAKALVSRAGRTAAEWLAAGGLTDPAVECAVHGPLSESLDQRGRLFTTGVMARITPTGPVPRKAMSDATDLCTLTEDGRTELRKAYHYSTIEAWPAVLPSHGEVIAAHLLPYTVTADQHYQGLGRTVLALAETDGPTGAAMWTLLARTLASRDAAEQAGAVDALLTFRGRGRLSAADLGAAVGRLVAVSAIKLNRVVAALGSAADAGAHADVCAVIIAALPDTLPAPGERPPTGLPDLLALGARSAESSGTRRAVPALAAVAARGGSSRLVREAARLHRNLTT